MQCLGLEGKVALVTGASRGIGAACAVALAEAGAQVVLVAREEARLQQVASTIRQGGYARALVVPADVRCPEDIKRAVRAGLEGFGSIDVLVNNAGINNRKSALEVTLAEWEEVLRVNLLAYFQFVQEVGRHMVSRRQGRIINVASELGVVGSAANQTAYCASKGGVIQFTKALALEWAKYNITVNAVCPTIVRTDMVAEKLAQPGFEEEQARSIPLGRIGEPRDVAGAVLFLASRLADYVTGHVLLVDGGYTAA